MNNFFGDIQTTGEFTMGGGDIEPIPSNTQLKACIDEIGWKTYQDDTYIEARWVVLDGEYKNRKIFQKIRVSDEDDKKRTKALAMLAAIDANCGGKLMEAGETPTDDTLAINLMNKPMAIKVFVWEMNDRKGNWIQSVSASMQQQKQTVNAAPISDDIPF